MVARQRPHAPLGAAAAGPGAGRRRALLGRLAPLLAAACLSFAVGFCLAAWRAAPPPGAAPTAPPSAPPPPPQLDARRRIALLQKAHGTVTLRGLGAALRAQKEVRAAGGWYGFLYSQHPAPGPGDGATLDALRATLGADSVFAVGSDDVAAALGRPLLEEQRRVMPEKEWAWVTNDVVDVTWFITVGEAALPSWAQHVWLMELDVGWTGDLVGALLSTISTRTENSGNSTATGAATDSNSSTSSSGGGGGGDGAAAADAAGAEPDWVAFNTQKADAGWRWFAARNWLADGEVWRSYRHAARASRRLLRAMAAALRASRVQSDEATAPSVCARHGGWCAMDLGWQPGHPAIGRDGGTGEALYRWELAIGPARWEGIVAADEAAARACREHGGGGGGRGGGCGGGGGQPSAAGAGGPASDALADSGCAPGRLYHALKW